MKIFALALLFLLNLNSLIADETISDTALKKMIGRMLIVGFDNEKLDANTTIIKMINKYDIGGVILFDRYFDVKSRVKNIRSAKQLQQLTTDLKTLAKKPLLISVDQEGGRVARLKPSYGFLKIESAQKISSQPLPHAKESYTKMAEMLHKNGINCNFAPVVDLALNPKNSVIVGLKRSFGKSPEKVSEYAKILIDAQKKEKIISVLKHFPGHGSSLSDSHKGFVDVSQTWSKVELEPYKRLINSGNVDMIMTAHVFNSHLDRKYPATLSHNVNTILLREKLRYKGVIVSDDLQMKAISRHYTLKEAVTLAINAGVDMLLFGNQLGNQDIDELVEIIFSQVKNKKIPYKRVVESNKRIAQLLEKIK